MYILVSLEKITLFFLKYNIDITQFTSFEQAILIILCNIFMILFYWFMLYVIYKFIFKILDWMNLR